MGCSVLKATVDVAVVVAVVLGCVAAAVVVKYGVEVVVGGCGDATRSAG
jgi:hypothetical protein